MLSYALYTTTATLLAIEIVVWYGGIHKTKCICDRKGNYESGLNEQQKTKKVI